MGALDGIGVCPAWHKLEILTRAYGREDIVRTEALGGAQKDKATHP
jgi:hypothetical protein